MTTEKAWDAEHRCPYGVLAGGVGMDKRCSPQCEYREVRGRVTRWYVCKWFEEREE